MVEADLTPTIGVRFSAFVAQQRIRITRRSRFALLMTALIGLLLWQTQWQILRPGLAILLAGQLGNALTLLLHTLKISQGQGDPLRWFDAELAFIKRTALFENSLRIAGLVVLAYDFWLATRNVIVALLIGVVYPLSAYFGMSRANYLRTVRQLETEREQVREALTA